MLSGNEIREKFLKYFEDKGHTRVSSSSLVPQNDPTLFFTNAGMVPFKDVFTGREKTRFNRATSSQKCMRVSGKHNDLENVGQTPRHHTFFEMLGNFSFGDYFKKEAIVFAWEFLTEVVKIPGGPLWITVFEKDDEAFELWQKEIGIAADRIVRCGEKDNFWSMGRTGPCGPCSEIHIDLASYLQGKPSKGNPLTHADDFMEVWNLVFMQYDRDESEKLTPLPKPSIDTGMGLERLAAVLQKVPSNYDTDLFRPLIEAFAKKTSHPYGKNGAADMSLRVLTDHIRAATFLINDGIQPGNEGRGYVLRRVLRRAIRHGSLLGMHEAFIHESVPILVDAMGLAYPDLEKNRSFICKVIKTEEERFLETLENGLDMIAEELKTLKQHKTKIFSGKTAFKLYDTFGFPLDLTEIIAAENSVAVNMGEFNQEMDKQKERARAAWKGSGQQAVDDLYHQLAKEKKSIFTGYETLQTNSKIVALICGGRRVNQVKEGFDAEVFVAETPFYGESGGQAGDRGVIESPQGKIEIGNTQKPTDGVISHHGRVLSGNLKIGDGVTLTVSASLRRPTMLNHTATHILHAALRKILGDHVKQAGSLVEARRLRFDFSHFEPVSRGQLDEIENEVNQVIQSNQPVKKQEMTQEQAKKMGALAFFGDKYGDRVRVVSVGDYSMEFCGGTHLDASGEIGLFKIISESSVASGVRRIEATTGKNALAEFQQLESQLQKMSRDLKTTPAELPQRMQKMSERVRELEREISNLKTRLAGGSGGADFMSQVQEIKGVKVLALEVPVDDAQALRQFSDQVINRLGSGIAVVAAKTNDTVSIIVRVSQDLTKKYQAGKLIAPLAEIVGGRGGGRPDMAQAGGKKVDQLKAALQKITELL